MLFIISLLTLGVVYKGCVALFSWKILALILMFLLSCTLIRDVYVAICSGQEETFTVKFLRKWWRPKVYYPCFIAGSVAGFIYTLKNMCADSHICCGSYGSKYLCLSCYLGREHHCETNESPTGKKGNRKGRKRALDDVEGISTEITDAISAVYPLTILGGVAAYKEAKILSEAFAGISKLIDGNLTIQGFVTQFTSSQAYQVTYTNWVNAFKKLDTKKVAYMLAGICCGAFLVEHSRKKGRNGSDGGVRRRHEDDMADQEQVMDDSCMISGFDRAASAVKNISTCKASGTCFKIGQYWVTVGHVLKEGDASISVGEDRYKLTVVKYFPFGTDGITILKGATNISVKGVPAGVLKVRGRGYVIGWQGSTPVLSIGEISPDGVHFCSTQYGHSGSPVFTKDGVCVGVHATGSSLNNGFIPFTTEIVSFLKAPSTAPVKSGPVDIPKEECIRRHIGKGSRQSCPPAGRNFFGIQDQCSDGQCQTPDLPLKKLKNMKRRERQRKFMRLQKSQGQVSGKKPSS